MDKKFTLVIPTKNRLKDLSFTLEKLSFLLSSEQVDTIIGVDGSADGTIEFLNKNYPHIKIIENKKSKGIHYTRNQLMNKVKTPYIISIDDDAHFLTENILNVVENYFLTNKTVGLLSFRAYWSKEDPKSIISDQIPMRVKGFGAVGFAIQTEVWNSIPNFPEWFVFYGEEDFAAFQLFKKGWEIHYVPQILVHHRVDLKARKKERDYSLRLRRSLRSGWYLYFMFYPWKLISRRMIYTIWIQIKIKVLKGDWKAGMAILQAFGDVIINLPRLLKQSNRLSMKEFKEYQHLADTILYWHPEQEKSIIKSNEHIVL